ncbi:hypothetical protein D3C72_852700 [compost metagenome]
MRIDFVASLMVLSTSSWAPPSGEKPTSILLAAKEMAGTKAKASRVLQSCMAVIVLQNLTGAQNMPRKAGKALDLDHRLLMPSA